MRAASGSITNITLHYGAEAASGGNVGTVPNQTGVTVSALNSTWQLVDLGIIQHPSIQVPFAVNTLGLGLRMFANFASKSDLQMDYVQLIPVDESYIEMDVVLTNTSADLTIIDGTLFPPIAYRAATSGVLLVAQRPTNRVGSFPTIIPGDNIFSVYMGQPSADQSYRTMDITIAYRPRYHFLRGS